MKKVNIVIGRFQPFTQGHLNMINEGDGPCIVYRINSSGKMPETLKGFKVGGRVIKADSVKTVANYIDNPEGDLTTQEKELLKRPFTNELIDKEFEIIKIMKKITLSALCAALCCSFAFANETTVTETTTENAVETVGAATEKTDNPE